MATSVYFNNFASSGEQALIEDLITESIKVYGCDVYYIARTYKEMTTTQKVEGGFDTTYETYDEILNEDDSPTYNLNCMIDMYIKNVDGFEGDGDFLSKFGLEIRDEITFTVSQRNWELEGAPQVGKKVPQAGDLIFFPLNDKVFKVAHVEHEAIFYQMGALQTYDIRCELFEYSNEVFETGISLIDDRYNILSSSSTEAIEDLRSVDPIADNEFIERAADSIIDFSESDPFSEGGRW